MELLINGKPLEAYSICACGCGDRCNSTEARYRPGHDARHVSKLLKLVKSGECQQNWAIHQLESDSLRVKLVNAIKREETRKAMKAAGATNRSIQKMNKHVDTDIMTVKDVDPVKIGRWVYPARQDKHGNIFRNIKTDGSGEWVAA